MLTKQCKITRIRKAKQVQTAFSLPRRKKHAPPACFSFSSVKGRGGMECLPHFSFRSHSHDRSGPLPRNWLSFLPLGGDAHFCADRSSYVRTFSVGWVGRNFSLTCCAKADTAKLFFPPSSLGGGGVGGGVSRSLYDEGPISGRSRPPPKKCVSARLLLFSPLRPTLMSPIWRMADSGSCCSEGEKVLGYPRACAGEEKKIASAHPFAGNCSRHVGAKCLLGPRGNDSKQQIHRVSVNLVCLYRYEKELGFCPSFFPLPKSTRRDQGRVEEEADLGKEGEANKMFRRREVKKLLPGKGRRRERRRRGLFLKRLFPPPATKAL